LELVKNQKTENKQKVLDEAAKFDDQRVSCSLDTVSAFTTIMAKQNSVDTGSKRLGSAFVYSKNYTDHK